MKKTILLFAFIFSFSFAFSQLFKIDNTKNTKITSTLTSYFYKIKIQTKDTTFIVYKTINTAYLYASDNYCVFSKSCGTGCDEYSVLIIGKQIEWKYYNQPYYVDFEKHFFIKRNPERTAIQAVDFLTGKIFWKRTITNKTALYSLSLSIDVSNGYIKMTINNIPQENLIAPYKSGETYTFRLPENF